MNLEVEYLLNELEPVIGKSKDCVNLVNQIIKEVKNLFIYLSMHFK
jgi:hypothetical protein